MEYKFTNGQEVQHYQYGDCIVLRGMVLDRVEFTEVRVLSQNHQELIVTAPAREFTSKIYP